MLTGRQAARQAAFCDQQAHRDQAGLLLFAGQAAIHDSREGEK